MLMLRFLKKALLVAVAGTMLTAALLAPASAAEGKKFKLAWSIYTGYMPWPYAEKSGILRKWADKYGIEI